VENNVIGRLLEEHSGELTILLIAALLLLTLLVLVPQLLRAQRQSLQMLHEEHMRSLERGLPVSPVDERYRAAGRISSLVPMVVVCAAATVTCFLAGYKYENLFAVSLTVWSVAGVVSLAAITGGVALMGRLAQLQAGDEDVEPPSNPLVKS
jgi:hypothetical protein